MLRTMFLALTTAALVLLASGCSDDPVGRQVTEPTSQSTQGSVTARDASVRFALPPGWELVGGGAPREWSDETVDSMAARTGVSPEEFRAQMAEVDLYARGPGGTLNVNTIESQSELPSHADLRALDERTGVAMEAVVDVDTPLGDGRVHRYRASVNRVEARGDSLFIAVDGHVVNITITTTDAARSRALMADLIPTLAPI